MPSQDEPRAPVSPGWYFAAASAAAALAVVVLFAATPVLPMTDLPQHEAQVAMWESSSAPDWTWSSRVRVQLGTPYLLGYAAARALTLFMPVHAAFRVLVALGVLALPLSLWVLLRRTGGDPWWALLGIPFAFGLPLAWGFLNFMLMIPLLVLILARSADWCESQRRRDGAVLAALVGVSFLGHFLAWAFAVACGIAICALRSDRTRLERVRLVVPYLLASPFVAGWLWVTWQASSFARLPTQWNIEPLQRILDLPAALAGPGWVGLVALLVAATALALAARPSRKAWRWVPWVLATLAWFGPARLGGTHYACERFVALLLPAALLAFVPRIPATTRVTVARALVTVLALAYPLALIPTWRPFAEEARALEAVSEPIDEGSRVYTFVIGRKAPGLGGSVLSNLHARLMVDRGIWSDYSFCRSPYPLIVLREQEPWANNPMEQSRSPEYAWLLVRSVRDPTRALAQMLNGWTLARRRGSWWLYARVPPDGEPTPPPGGG